MAHPSGSSAVSFKRAAPNGAALSIVRRDRSFATFTSYGISHSERNGFHRPLEMVGVDVTSGKAPKVRGFTRNNRLQAREIVTTFSN